MAWIEQDVAVAPHRRTRAAINLDNVLYARDDGAGGTFVVFSGGPSANIQIPYEHFRGYAGMIPGWNPPD